MSTSPLQLFLLTAAIIFIATTATAPISPLLPPPPPPHSSSDHFAPILAKLGFRDLASAAASLSTTAPPWRGPATIFAPTDSSLLSCPSCSLPLLLQELTLPGLYSLPFLLSLPFATKIQTLSPSPRCLTITSDHHHRNLFVNGVEITRPELYSDRNVVVHGINGFVSHLSPLSCVIERTTSLSFPPTPPPVKEFFLMRSMLDDAMLRLRISGFSVLALALKVKYFPELLEMRSVTVFAVDDTSIFAAGGHSFVRDLRMHVVPNRRLAAADLEGLAAATVLPTLDLGRDLVVTTAGGGGPLAPMRINYVKIARNDLVWNSKIVVHGLAVPFELVNQTDAVDLARIGRCRFIGLGSDEVEGKSGVCEKKVVPVAVNESTVEIEGHHGL